MIPRPASSVRANPARSSVSMSVLLPDPGPPVRTTKRSTSLAKRRLSPCRPDLLQALRRLIEGLIAFAEGEPHLLRAILGIAIETRPRHSRHANFADQVLRECEIVGVAEAADVGHH